jgi:cytochrome c2
MSVNMWIEYVKNYSQEKGISYKDAMKEAKVSYNKLKVKSGGAKKEKKQCEGCKYNSPGQKNHMGPGGCLAENSNNNSNSNHNANNNSNHNVKNNHNGKKHKKQCEGCKYNSPSQRNHMGPGGCLEEDSDDE